VSASFQSLFSWNLLLMSGSLHQFQFLQAVSILVFVELALDACFFGNWFIYSF